MIFKKGRTGFKYGDSLTQYERDSQIRKFHEEIKPNISPEDLAKVVLTFKPTFFRKKKRENNERLKNVDDVDVYLEIINNDLPKQFEQAVKELESVDFELASRLKEKQIPGSDAFPGVDEIDRELAAMIKSGNQ